MLWEIISPQSLYFSMVVFGCFFFIYSNWAVAQWVYERPKRRKEQEQATRKTELRKRNEAVKRVTDFIELIDEAKRARPFQPENALERADLLILKENLIGTGVIPEIYRNKAHSELKMYLKDVLPDIIQLGIEREVDHFLRLR